MATSTGSNLRSTLHTTRVSALRKYAALVVGRGGLGALLNYEARTLFLENLPGALGIILRRILYRHLFGKMGKNVILGKGITLRHAWKISLGDNVAIDDYCTLDARGDDDSSISIGDNTIISRNTILRTKDGTIAVGQGSGIGSNCMLASSSTIESGENLLMASYVCILAGGEHSFDRVDLPIVSQGMFSKGGVSIGSDVWIGTRVTILDGVRIGDHAVIGACSMVNKDIPDYAVAYGTPAKRVKDRREITNTK
ncbi:MAG: DapH/DapD/GlmU-related protein [Candidatus Aureabacteria bacterium]|nr:DapH/DapD/GlmU-related protein [Candidatus Auribacterota bacterium]